MDSNDHELLERIARLTEQNNRLLHRMHRSMIWSHIFQVLYWAVIIVITLGLYYFIKPYLGPLNTIIQKLSSVAQLPQLPTF